MLCAPGGFLWSGAAGRLSRRCLALVAALVWLATAAPAQYRMIPLQVRLTFADGSRLDTVEGTANVDANTRSGGGQTPISNISIAMQIRVQILDSFGAVIGEKSPERDGRVSFNIPVPVLTAGDPHVEKSQSYRLRVFGPEIEEVVLEGVDPQHGERMINVALHRKRDANAPRVAGGAPSGAIVPLARLNIPDKAKKELEKGNGALQRGSLDEAERHFHAAIDLYPQYDQAYNNLGVTLMQRERKDEARQAFQKAIECNDKFARAYTNLGRLALIDKNYAEADSLLQKALQADPRHPESLLLASQAALMTSRFEAAVSNARLLHSLPHEQMGFAHFIAARALEAQAKPDEAVLEYRQFLKEAPNSPNAPAARASLKRLTETAKADPRPKDN